MELFILLEAAEPINIISHWQILGSLGAILLSGLIGWISALINGKIERAKIKLQFDKNNEKISERDRLIMDQMKGFDNKLVEISMDIIEIKNDTSFRSRLMNSIRTIATNIIDYNVDLDSKYKHLIMQMAREFEDFALRFYYSDMRGISHEISPFLRIDMDSRIAKFETYAEHINAKPKKYVSPSGKVSWIFFGDFLLKTDIMVHINKLILILEKNGLSPNDVIEQFDKFISVFFKDFIKAILIWEAIGKKIIIEKENDMLNDDEIEEIRNESEKEQLKDIEEELRSIK